MDITWLKKKALSFKDTAKKAGKDALEYGAGKLADSKFTLKDTKELQKFVQKSRPTKWKDSTTGKEKTYSHRVIIIFANPESDFFTRMVYELPILAAKSFSQNIALRLADATMKDLDTKHYQIQKDPVLVVIEDEKPIKHVVGDEAIKKIVTSMSLDIDSQIEAL